MQTLICVVLETLQSRMENIVLIGPCCNSFRLHYTSKNLYTVRTLLCFVVVNSLQWRHSVFRPRSKKASKLRVTGLSEGNSSVTDAFPVQRASKAENASIWWRYDVSDDLPSFPDITLLTFDNISLPQYQQYRPNKYEQMDQKNYKELGQYKDGIVPVYRFPSWR